MTATVDTMFSRTNWTQFAKEHEILVDSDKPVQPQVQKYMERVVREARGMYNPFDSRLFDCPVSKKDINNKEVVFEEYQKIHQYYVDNKDRLAKTFLGYFGSPPCMAEELVACRIPFKPLIKDIRIISHPSLLIKILEKNKYEENDLKAAFLAAISINQPEAVKIFLKLKPEFAKVCKIEGKTEKSPMELAISTLNIELVTLLADHGAVLKKEHFGELPAPINFYCFKGWDTVKFFEQIENQFKNMDLSFLADIRAQQIELIKSYAPFKAAAKMGIGSDLIVEGQKLAEAMAGKGSKAESKEESKVSVTEKSS